MSEPDHIAAHQFSSNHRAQLAASERCGCFYCCHTFPPESIEEWVNSEGTALCPFCGIDSVIGSSSGYPITDDFLTKMKSHWFATPEILYRVVDHAELDAIRESGWRRFPARAPGQPIFTTLRMKEDAIRRILSESFVECPTPDDIASLIEGPTSVKTVYVTVFCVSEGFLRRFEARGVGDQPFLQYSIPEEDLDAFNDHILDVIQLVREVGP